MQPQQRAVSLRHFDRTGTQRKANAKSMEQKEQTISKHIYDVCIIITDIAERDKLRAYIKDAEKYELVRYSKLTQDGYGLFTTIQQSEKGV